MELLHCPLCGFEFDAATGRCAPACPLKRACNFICCPRCGYQIVDASRAASVKFLRRWWNRDVERIESKKTK